jgi:hypothetical protein
MKKLIALVLALGIAAAAVAMLGKTSRPVTGGGFQASDAQES